MDNPDAGPADDTPESAGIPRERRRARRHKVFTPAYANLSGSSQGAILELSEILNISESGMCIQASSQMKVNRLLPLGIDLSETGVQIRTVGHVVWSEPSGRTGIRLVNCRSGWRQTPRRGWERVWRAGVLQTTGTI